MLRNILGIVLAILSCSGTNDKTGATCRTQKIVIVNETHPGILRYPNTCGNQGITDLVVSLYPNGTFKPNCYLNNFLVSTDNGVYNVHLNQSAIDQNISMNFVLGPNPEPWPSLREPRYESIVGSPDLNTTLQPKQLCKGRTYNESLCKGETNSYRITISNNSQNICVKCDPRAVPDKIISIHVNNPSDPGKPSYASQFMKNLTSLYDDMQNVTTMAVSAGEIKGLMVKIGQLTKNTDFAISDSGVDMAEGSGAIKMFATSVSIPLEALQKASSNNTKAFLGIFVFANMSKDAKNSTVLNDKVIAIEMGTAISGLATPINISFHTDSFGNVSLKPSCQSWNGAGALTWTPSGCDTAQENTTVTCKCTHLTFFAILMVPDVNVSASDLTALTYITYIGCALSMFFLCIVLFAHFVLRKAKSSRSTKILINLIVAMLLLNATFLSNDWISSLGSVPGCKVMAAVMHYSMLATFSWFAIEAFHLCFQLTKGSSGGDRYVLKLCLTGWVLPALVVVVLLSLGKYGQYAINSGDGKNAQMCWITDSLVQYVVNIAYYALVFLFNFTVFIIIIRRLIYITGQKGSSGKQGLGKADIFTIMGVCCLLGLGWGFAFLSYGPFRVTGLYIFTILNSFQGFFLFLYYYKSSKALGDDKEYTVSSKSTATACSVVEQNPYANFDSPKSQHTGASDSTT